MAIVGRLNSKGFDIENAYINIGMISFIKVPFAEKELQVTFRIYKDKETYINAPKEDKNSQVIEFITLYINAEGLDSEQYIRLAYERLKEQERFEEFVDEN